MSTRLAVVVATATGCTGSFSEQPSAPSQSASSSPTSSPDDASASPFLPRISAGYYRNAIIDIFGADAPRPVDLPAIPSVLQSEAIGSAGAAFADASVLDPYLESGWTIATWATADTARRGALGICDASDAHDPCLASSLSGLALRVWRRPATAEEMQALATVASTLAAAGATAGQVAAAGIAGLLFSPDFLYRVEPPGDAAGHLTGFALASRLAYALWQGPPDLPLLGAATSGALDTPAGFAAQMQRMVGDARFARGADYLFADWFHMEDLTSSVVAAATGLGADGSETLASALREQFRLEFQRVLQPGQDFRALFTAGDTLANASLATYLGLPAPAGSDPIRFGVVSLPAPRRGVLSSGGFLVRYGGDSPVIHRGRFIRTALLCQPIPDPPAVIADQIAAQNTAPVTNHDVTISRARSAARLATSPCDTCHKLMDPLGLGFDPFTRDGLVTDSRDGVRTTADGTYTSLGHPDPAPFVGPGALADLLTSDPSFARCVQQNILSRLLARPLTDAAEDVAALDAMTGAFVAANYDITVSISQAVQQPAFRLPAPVGATDAP